MTIPKGGFKAGKQTATQVLQQGTGPAVSATQIAYVDYVAVDATTRKTLFSTFGQRFVPVPMSDTTQLPGLVKAIQGKKVGTTQKVAVPASQGFGAQGSSTLGVGATDTLVFYLRINAAANIATPAAGAQAPAPQGLKVVVPSAINKPATHHRARWGPAQEAAVAERDHRQGPQDRHRRHRQRHLHRDQLAHQEGLRQQLQAGQAGPPSS